MELATLREVHVLLVGDDDDPPDPSRTVVDDDRDGEPDEEETARDQMFDPPTEPSPFVQRLFADPRGLPSERDLHHPPFPKMIHNLIATPREPRSPAEEAPSTPPRRITSSFPNYVFPEAKDTPFSRFTISPIASSKPTRKQPRERSVKTRTVRGETVTTENGTEIQLLKVRKAKEPGRARSSDRTGPGNSPRSAAKEDKDKKTPGKKTLKSKTIVTAAVKPGDGRA